MLIFLVVVCSIFSFFIDWGQPHFLVLIGYALSFALINAVLEERCGGDTYLVICKWIW